MDKLNDFIKNMKIKTVLYGGFDKEDVYVHFKELIHIFQEIMETNQSSSSLTLNDDFINEINHLKQYQEAYQELNVKYEKLKNSQNDETHQELFHELLRLQKYEKQYLELKEKYDQLKLEKKIVSETDKNRKYIKDQIIEENNDLKEENIRLKEALFNTFNNDIYLDDIKNNK